MLVHVLLPLGILILGHLLDFFSLLDSLLGSFGIAVSGEVDDETTRLQRLVADTCATRRWTCQTPGPTLGVVLEPPALRMSSSAALDVQALGEAIDEGEGMANATGDAGETLAANDAVPTILGAGAVVVVTGRRNVENGNGDAVKVDRPFLLVREGGTKAGEVGDDVGAEGGLLVIGKSD